MFLKGGVIFMTKKNIHLLIGGLSKYAMMFAKYFQEREISTENVERNPLVIQYNMFVDPPDGVVISSKTKYLRQLCENINTLEKRPYIILVDDNDNYFADSRTPEITDFIVKNSDGIEKSYNGFMEFINSKSYQTINRKNNYAVAHLKKENTESEDENAISLHNTITKILAALCVTPNYNGYNYIRESIKLAITDCGAFKGISKQIYPVVAKKMNATASGVERSMRTAIHRSWCKVKTSDKVEIFGTYALQEGWIPTNSEYIFIIAERITCKLKSEQLDQ